LLLRLFDSSNESNSNFIFFEKYLNILELATSENEDKKLEFGIKLLKPKNDAIIKRNIYEFLIEIYKMFDEEEINSLPIELNKAEKANLLIIKGNNINKIDMGIGSEYIFKTHIIKECKKNNQKSLKYEESN
jgi:hypothetical protein